MSRRKRARRIAAWQRYVNRNDRLVAGQQCAAGLDCPVRTNPGYFRAEGWDTDADTSLRHGA